MNSPGSEPAPQRSREEQAKQEDDEYSRIEKAFAKMEKEEQEKLWRKYEQQ